MPKYVVHIGPPKTGSKYIQSQLFYSRQDLRENGILYPDNWLEPGAITHVPLYEGLKDGKDLKADFDQFKAEQMKTVVLSCEGLDGLKPPALEKLREYIGNNPVEIVYYVRQLVRSHSVDVAPIDYDGKTRGFLRVLCGNYAQRSQQRSNKL